MALALALTLTLTLALALAPSLSISLSLSLSHPLSHIPSPPRILPGPARIQRCSADHMYMHGVAQLYSEARRPSIQRCSALTLSSAAALRISRGMPSAAALW